MIQVKQTSKRRIFEKRVYSRSKPTRQIQEPRAENFYFRGAYYFGGTVAIGHEETGDFGCAEQIQPFSLLFTPQCNFE